MKKICLIVDDSRVVRKVARRIAEDLGFDCEESENGFEAFKSCEAALPDVVLLDWNMPTMSGLEFLEKLRALPGNEKTRIVLCTTESDQDHINRALTAGADEYIVKPFDNEMIREKFTRIGLLGNKDNNKATHAY